MPTGNLSLNASRVLKVFLIAALSAIALFPVIIAARAGQYDSIADDPISAFGLWGTFIIHMWTRPSRKECAATVLLAITARMIYDFLVGERGYPGSILIGFGLFLGASSMLVLTAGVLFRRGEARALRGRTLAVCALFFYIGVFLAFYISFARIVLPRKLDFYLFTFDSSLGFQASFAAGRLFLAWKPLIYAEAMVYNSLGLAFGVLYAAHANHTRKLPVNILKLLMLNPVVGFSLYFLYPAAGPKYAFPSFPTLPDAVQPAAAFIAGAPNCMPSLHLAGALLIFWLARPWKWLRATAAVYLAMTALATLGFGEHYLVDLVVAVPYALALEAFVSAVPERRMPARVGALILAGWLGFLHLSSFSPIVSWAAVLATLAVCFELERRLALRIFTLHAPSSPHALETPAAPIPALRTAELGAE